MGFDSLQHMRNSRSTRRGLKAARSVPPSGFGYPLDGLLPRIPCRFFFAPAALLGFTLRRFHLPGGSAGFRLGKPTYRSLGGVPGAEASNRPGQAAISGSMPPESALRPCECLARRSPAPPLGFAPLGRVGENLGLDFSGPPLARFAGSDDCSPNPPASQSLDRPSLGPTRQQHRSARRLELPFWGSCTCPILIIRVR